MKKLLKSEICGFVNSVWAHCLWLTWSNNAARTKKKKKRSQKTQTQLLIIRIQTHTKSTQQVQNFWDSNFCFLSSGHPVKNLRLSLGTRGSSIVIANSLKFVKSIFEGRPLLVWSIKFIEWLFFCGEPLNIDWDSIGLGTSPKWHLFSP